MTPESKQAYAIQLLSSTLNDMSVDSPHALRLRKVRDILYIVADDIIKLRKVQPKELKTITIGLQPIN